MHRQGAIDLKWLSQVGMVWDRPLLISQADPTTGTMGSSPLDSVGENMEVCCVN